MLPLWRPLTLLLVVGLLQEGQSFIRYWQPPHRGQDYCGQQGLWSSSANGELREGRQHGNRWSVTMAVGGGGKGFGKKQPQASDGGEKVPSQPSQSNGAAGSQVSGATGVQQPRKFQMMYTCNICEGRNLITVDRLAFTEGIVVARCKHCDSKHLVADNLSKLDFGKGKVTLDDVLALRGEKASVVDLSNNPDLSRYSLRYKDDGTVEMMPKVENEEEEEGEPPSAVP